jgi:cobalt/nickel transport system permease protein
MGLHRHSTLLCIQEKEKLMHIPDGMVPGEVCAAGFASTALLTWFSLGKVKKLYPDPARMISRASVMAAAFFVVSWIHIPLPPVSVHPILAGLIGILLGWLSIPTILIGLFFQAAMFGHGGFTTLGLNTLTMGGAALLSWFLYRGLSRGNSAGGMMAAGFTAGFMGVMIAAVSTALILILTIPSYIDPAAERAGILTMVVSHLPLAVAEGIFTAMIAAYLKKTSPEMLA